LQQLEGTNHNEEGPNDDDELRVMESKVMIVGMVTIRILNLIKNDVTK
jgi:hypothetical protein